MKKLYMIITLFVSSFFFASYEVKASYKEITDLDISTYITDDFLLSHEEAVSRGWKYIVVYDSNTYKYFVLQNNSGNTPKYTLDNSNLKLSGVTWYRWSNNKFSSVISNYNASFSSSSISIIDSSSDIFPTSSFDIVYNDIVYPATIDKKIITVYDVYNDLINGPSDNPHQEEIEKVDSFYTLCIDKLSYLVISIVSNYIYLSIFGIFILIMIFELIKRRFL